MACAERTGLTTGPTAAGSRTTTLARAASCLPVLQQLPEPESIMRPSSMPRATSARLNPLASNRPTIQPGKLR